MHRNSHPSGSRHIRQRILLVEDDESFAEVLRNVLETDGHYDVLVAADSFEAENYMSERGFDLIVTDWRLPDFTGFRGLIRADATLSRDPEAPGDWFRESIPVIVVTACDAEEIERAKKPKGKFHFLGVVSKKQPLDGIAEQIHTIFKNAPLSATA
jgi:CheY-like chemotaxis protein